MIYINLTPEEELENKNWYVPDLLVVIVFGVGTLFATNFDINQKNDTLADVVYVTGEMNSRIKNLEVDIKKYKVIDLQVKNLGAKINSLKQITSSPLKRYEPLILIDILQILKPEGIWFTHLVEETQNSIIRIIGGSFDSMIIAEFMSQLSSLKHKLIDIKDLKTQIYFSEVFLEKISSLSGISGGNANTKDKPNMSTAVGKADRLIEKTRSQHLADTQKFFPDIKGFPIFEINLKYAHKQISLVDSEESLLEIDNL